MVILGLFLVQVVSAAGPAPVNLGSAGSFAILSKSGISTTGTTSIVGNIGVSPAAATYITGFGLTMDSSNQFATSSLVTGKAYAADYTPPTPTTMTTAVSDMQTAYTDAAGRTNPTATELGAGNIGGMTLAPGLYKWSTGLTIPTSVTLNCQGNSSSVFIFQIAQTLNLGNGAAITLSGGCQPQNIFWQVAGQASLGTTSNFEGIILSQTAIVVNTGATVNGRLMAQTAVTLDADTVTMPTGSATTPTPTPTPSTTNTITTVTTTVPATTNTPTGPTAPTTTITPTTSGSVITSAGSTAPTTNGSVSAILPAATGGSKPLFTWQGSGYYEIPSGGSEIPATGMAPGVVYLITNPAFISNVNSWLRS